MKMGQVWSKADFDGLQETGHEGGHGSVLAVTAQNPGEDDLAGTDDDVVAPLNELPAAVSIDAAVGPNCKDAGDRVRGFFSFHTGGAHFLFTDGSVDFIQEDISPRVYQALSTIAGRETVTPADY